MRWAPSGQAPPRNHTAPSRSPETPERLSPPAASEAPGVPGTLGIFESPPPMWQALAFWKFLTAKLSSTSSSCPVLLWVGAPPLSLHHPHQQLSSPERVGRKHPAGSVPSMVRWLPLLSRTRGTPLFPSGAELPQLWGRLWGGHQGGISLESHRRLGGCVPLPPGPKLLMWCWRWMEAWRSSGRSQSPHPHKPLQSKL